MSGSEPVWADRNKGGGGAWWSSPTPTPTRSGRGQRVQAARRREVAKSFYPRLAVVKAVYNDGSREQAEAITRWINSTDCGSAYVEQLALGNWGVVILRPEHTDALWLLTDQHLVLDPRREPKLDVLTDEAFRACYESRHEARVRECPIYEDRETAS